MELFQRIKSRVLARPISLRLLVAVGISFPILLFLTLLSLFHYWQENRILEDQQRYAAERMGSLLSQSISHSLLTKDGTALLATFSEIGHTEDVKGIQIIGTKGHVLFASDMSLSIGATDFSSPGCRDCHRFASEGRPRTVDLDEGTQSMRIATPISNSRECLRCHGEESETLGVLLLDISLEKLKAFTLANLGREVGFSALVTLLLMSCTYIFISIFVVQRIEAFKKPISAYAEGDRQARISEPIVLNDEINALANTFNYMADEISLHAKQQEDRSKLRQHAIIEERERIGRELHDGLAQVLGYVANKAVAVRLMLEKKNLEDAESNLTQLEEAARMLLADMREDILGLKTASQVDANLCTVLREYIKRYNSLCDRPVEFHLPENGDVVLDPSIVLQLTRIVQEALSNVRKHAGAAHTSLRVSRADQALTLEVTDDGRGFDMASTLDGRTEGFGLGTMRERAEEIGASLSIHSQPGVGTTVQVRLELGDRSEV